MKVQSMFCCANASPARRAAPATSDDKTTELKGGYTTYLKRQKNIGLMKFSNGTSGEPETVIENDLNVETLKHEKYEAICKDMVDKKLKKVLDVLPYSKICEKYIHTAAKRDSMKEAVPSKSVERMGDVSDTLITGSSKRGSIEKKGMDIDPPNQMHQVDDLRASTKHKKLKKVSPNFSKTTKKRKTSSEKLASHKNEKGDEVMTHVPKDVAAKAELSSYTLDGKPTVLHETIVKTKNSTEKIQANDGLAINEDSWTTTEKMTNIQKIPRRNTRSYLLNNELVIPLETDFKPLTNSPTERNEKTILKRATADRDRAFNAVYQIPVEGLFLLNTSKASDYIKSMNTKVTKSYKNKHVESTNEEKIKNRPHNKHRHFSSKKFKKRYPNVVTSSNSINEEDYESTKEKVEKAAQLLNKVLPQTTKNSERQFEKPQTFDFERHIQEQTDALKKCISNCYKKHSFDSNLAGKREKTNEKSYENSNEKSYEKSHPNDSDKNDELEEKMIKPADIAEYISGSASESDNSNSVDSNDLEDKQNEKDTCKFKNKNVQRKHVQQRTAQSNRTQKSRQIQKKNSKNSLLGLSKERVKNLSQNISSIQKTTTPQRITTTQSATPIPLIKTSQRSTITKLTTTTQTESKSKKAIRKNVSKPEPKIKQKTSTSTGPTNKTTKPTNQFKTTAQPNGKNKERTYSYGTTTENNKQKIKKNAATIKSITLKQTQTKVSAKPQMKISANPRMKISTKPQIKKPGKPYKVKELPVTATMITKLSQDEISSYENNFIPETDEEASVEVRSHKHGKIKPDLLDNRLETEIPPYLDKLSDSLESKKREAEKRIETSHKEIQTLQFLDKRRPNYRFNTLLTV